MADHHFILASASPRRRELLAGLGFLFTVAPAAIDERPRPGEAIADYVARLAAEKALAVAPASQVILAADTIVAVDGELLGKPRHDADACRMLRRLSGRRHEVLTGVGVLAPGSARPTVEVVGTDVVFAPLDDLTIDAYVATGEPRDKAGAYAIQGLAAAFIEGIEGNYTNVVGLPLPTAVRLLDAAGVPLPLRAPRQPSGD